MAPGPQAPGDPSLLGLGRQTAGVEGGPEGTRRGAGGDAGGGAGGGRKLPPRDCRAGRAEGPGRGPATPRRAWGRAWRGGGAGLRPSPEPAAVSSNPSARRPRRTSHIWAAGPRGARGRVGPGAEAGAGTGPVLSGARGPPSRLPPPPRPRAEGPAPPTSPTPRGAGDSCAGARPDEQRAPRAPPGSVQARPSSPRAPTLNSARPAGGQARRPWPTRLRWGGGRASRTHLASPGPRVAAAEPPPPPPLGAHPGLT